ncbi:hypothetical protein V2J09_002409 [Rumex salicifolius]
MIEIMNPVKESINGGHQESSSINPQLWHACAGGMVQIPPLNSNVIYFPQGHLDHAQINLDPGFPTNYIPALVPCRVTSIKYLAHPETDQVYAKIRLTPIQPQDLDSDETRFSPVNIHSEGSDKPGSFAKTLTQSDANNGGGFSVPRYCAETIFPRLDYSAEPPVQTVIAKDVHGETWKFRHIYRGTPRRHLLTTGWSGFVNRKKLVAGDSVVFMRDESGDLCVGIRRAKKWIGFGPEPGSYEMCKPGSVEPVVEAVKLAARGEPFEVVYYPGSSSPEFFVKASDVRASMEVNWCPGMRFKMAFETEDSSRISWFMGTISGARVADPVHWPNSPWRLLQVEWDEPELLQNVKSVNPWLVEMVATMPTLHIPPFASPRKKPCLVDPHDFAFIAASNKNLPTGVQGDRHTRFQQSLATLGKMQLGLLPAFLRQQPQSVAPKLHALLGHNNPRKRNEPSEDASCDLTMGISHSKKSSVRPKFMLFGKPILTEEQISQSSSGDSSSSSVYDPTDGSSEEVLTQDKGRQFKVNLRLGDVRQSQIFDTPVLGSYEETYKKLVNIFGMGKSEMLSNDVYKLQKEKAPLHFKAI